MIGLLCPFSSRLQTPWHRQLKCRARQDVWCDGKSCLICKQTGLADKPRTSSGDCTATHGMSCPSPSLCNNKTCIWLEHITPCHVTVHQLGVRLSSKKRQDKLAWSRSSFAQKLTAKRFIRPLSELHALPLPGCKDFFPVDSLEAQTSSKRMSTSARRG